MTESKSDREGAQGFYSYKEEDDFKWNFAFRESITFEIWKFK